MAEKVAQDTQCHLVRMRESPDAELRDPSGDSIGLEVVSTVDQDLLASRRRMMEATQAIEAAIRDSGLQIHVDVGFDVQSLGVATDNSQHRRWLKDLNLLSVVGAQTSGELDQGHLQAAGIQRIAWLSWQASQTPGVGWGYSKRTECGRTLADICLAKKHLKLAKYKAKGNDGLKSFWLAIDGLGAGTPEDGGFSMLLERDYETSYDRVFLMIRGSGGGFAEARDVTPPRKLAE